jgi:hypothetical protein
MAYPASPKTRAKALALYRTHGPTEAARQCGVSKAAVCKWALAEGVSTDVPGLTAATSASVARRNLKTAEWREEMAALLRDVTLRAAEVEWTLLNQPTTPSLDKVSNTRAKAVSDLLLITGEATQRIGLQGDSEEHAASVAKLRDELAERRKQAQAG